MGAPFVVAMRVPLERPDSLEDRLVRDDREERAGNETGAGDAERPGGETLVSAADRGGDQREQDRERGDPDGAVDETDAATEDREGREEPGDDLAGPVAGLLRGAQRVAATRAARVRREEPCGPPRRGLRGGRRRARGGRGRSGSSSGAAGSSAGSGGAGSALIAQ